MRVVSYEVTPLDLVPRVALTVAYGSYPVFEYALLVLRTDTGDIGLGEASPDPAVTGETQAGVMAALEAMGRCLVGRDPLELTAALEAARAAAPGFPAALAAVDMALYDLAGKALGVPVSKLLGGAVREGMQLYPVVPMDSPEVMAAMAQSLKAMDSPVLKLKVGSRDLDLDVARVAAVAAVAGNAVRLRLDANQGWGDAGTAIEAIRRLSAFNVEYIEQPVAAADLRAMAAVTAATEVPIMADESCHTAADALAIVRQSAADMINIKLMKCGGIRRALDILAVAEAAGMPCILGSMVESTIGSAAGMHLAVSRVGITSCELIGPLFVSGDPATGYIVDASTGWAEAPRGAGLGVELCG
ncbi:MAG: dipeptide epimerase [Anaerolineae bacterium]|nr:dipeptide epimerase [Anaerolineae bacterium]